MKKLLSMILVLMLAMGAFAAMAAAEETEAGTVRMLAAVTGGKDEEENTLWAEALSEATGLNVIVEKPASDYDNILMQKLSAGESYDLIYISASQYLNLVQQGALTDLTDYIDASEILSNNVPASEWEDLKVDGRIYAGFNKRELHIMVGLNKVMLEAAGIDYTQIEPTLDGYYEVFKALREANPSTDFYPFNTILSQNWDLQPWMASVGLKGGVVVDEDGQTYVPYATDAAAPVWEWLKKLYDEELLDPASFVDATKDMRNKLGAASKQTAVDVDWAAWAGLQNANAAADGVTTDEYEIVTLPGCKTPDGDYIIHKGSASLFAVPVNATNVEGAVKVLEYFATQEGGLLLTLGVEGNDYTVSDDGTYTLTEIGASHAMDHGAPVPIYKDFVNPIGLNLGLDAAMEYLDDATIEKIIPNEGTYKEIVGKWGISIVKGEVDVTSGLESMRNELVTMGVCDK
ncbi:MAG: extracellular solute-binding protein [Candidatus Faecivicinus sp.]